jgi:thiol-disulfide isomerase/thioredoxin
MKFKKKHFSNILFGIFILLLIIPQTRMPIQVFLQRMIAFSPSTIKAEKRETIVDYSWQLRELNGEAVNLNTSENRVTLINLWATWCPPCIAEMPSLQALYDDYGAQVDFYFVSNEKTETLNRFMERHSYSLPIYQPMEDAPSLLNSRALPTTYVINKKGEVVINKTGAANWNSPKTREILDKLLAE